MLYEIRSELIMLNSRLKIKNAEFAVEYEYDYFCGGREQITVQRNEALSQNCNDQ